MSSPQTSGDSTSNDAVAQFNPGTLDDAALQQLIVKVLRAYIARRDDGHEIPPFTGEQLTATEVVMVAAELLEAGGLDLVDLSIWRGLGTKPSTGDDRDY